MKRTKTVFRSDEIAHVWANQGAPMGRRSDGNMSFNGDAFKSYATVIGNRIRHKGRVAYVVDCASFSNSTSTHQSHMRGAIRNADKVFCVRIGEWGQDLVFTPQTLRDHYLTEYRTPAEHSRYAHIRAERLLHKASHLADAIDVCVYFGLPHKSLDREQAKLTDSLAAARVVVDAKKEALSQARDKRWAAQRARQDADHLAQTNRAIEAAKQAIESGQMPENVYYTFGFQDRLLESRPDLKAGIADLRIRLAASEMQDWLAGQPVQPSYDWPTLLRAEDNEMVTTRGARVPLSDAKRTYAFIRARRAKGWHANGEKHSIGMYALESVNEQGVVVGCHRVTWSEVDRFAAQMGWQTPGQIEG